MNDDRGGGGSQVDPLVALLLRHEGLRRSPYRDASGNLTVGVGHNITANPILPAPNYPLTVTQCFDLLVKDISDVEDELTLAFAWFPTLDRVRQAAVTDLCFNVGIGALKNFFRFLGYIQKSNWNGAAGDL